MDEIIDKIKSNNNKYFWFIPKGNRLSLIAQGKSKSEVKRIFKEKLLNLSTNPEKYHNIDIIVAKIEVLKEIDMFAGGPIGINFYFKKINDKGKIVKKKDDRVNTMWFTEKYLLKNGFKSEYMIKILTSVYFNKINLPIGVLTYDYYSKKI